MLINEYFNEYTPDNFDIIKLLEKKYRCIRYFNEKHVDKYQQSLCQAYLVDYLEFKLEKSRYIFIYYSYNIVMISLILIIYLVL